MTRVLKMPISWMHLQGCVLAACITCWAECMFASQVLQPVSSTATLHTTSTQQLPQIPVGPIYLGKSMDHALTEAHIAGQHEIVFEGRCDTAASVYLCAACSVCYSQASLV